MPPISAKITHVLGGNISLLNKIPLVLHVPLLKVFHRWQNKYQTFFIKLLYTSSIWGVACTCTTVNIQSTRMTESFNTNMCHDSRTMTIRHQNGKAKWNMSLRYTCKETAENGRLKKYCCVHAFQVNYNKPSDCNKIIRHKFNESFHF